MFQTRRSRIRSRNDGVSKYESRTLRPVHWQDIGSKGSTISNNSASASRQVMGSLTSVITVITNLSLSD
jgi:hypothetical protein